MNIFQRLTVHLPNVFGRGCISVRPACALALPELVHAFRTGARRVANSGLYMSGIASGLQRPVYTSWLMRLVSDHPMPLFQKSGRL